MTQVTRRNNPYAASFESAGSLSASLDKSQQMAYDPTFHLKANVVQRTPVENMITEYQGDTNGGDFDVHSDCSDDHHASLTGSPITTPDSGSQQCCPQHFDAATMTAFLAEMGCIVDCPCPAGSIITVYNGDISQHFNIPSEQVQITRGVIKYADHQARYGAQTRFRFQLCHNYLQRKCTKLSECSYIHATVLPKPSEVHLNPFAPRRLAADRHGRSGDVTPSHFDDPSIADAYPTMQPGLTITVHPPQGNQTSNELTQVPSEMIIRTTGAEQTIAAYLEAGGAEPASFPPDQLPRHCTKFQYRRVCTSGSGCPFIHSKIPFPGTWIGIGGGSTPNPTAAVQQQQPQGIPSAAMFAAAQPYPGAFVQGPQGAAPGIAYATVPAAPAAPQMFFMPTPVPMDPHHQAATLVPTGLGQSWAPQPSFVHHPGAPTMMMAAPAPPPPQPQGLPYMFQPAPTAHGHHPMQYIVMMPPSAQ